MTTPAGWYDDGSGRQRWWDGAQWTEHFAPVAEPVAPVNETAVDADAATPLDASTPATADATPAEAASVEPVPADAAPVEAAPVEAAPAEAVVPPAEAAPAEAAPAEAAPTEAVVPPAEAAPAEAVVTPAVAPAETPSWSAPGDGAAPHAQETQPFVAPGATAPTAPLQGSVPQYAVTGDTQAYPGQAYPGQTYPGQAYPTPDAYPGAAAPQGYPQAGTSYPPAGYPAYAGAAAPTAPASVSVLGLVGLGLAALGVVLAFVPITWAFSWILLGAGLIVSIVSLFLAGKKWPGIVGLSLAVVGGVIATVIGLILFVFGAVGQAIDAIPTDIPSISTDGGDDEGAPTDGEVAQGQAGEAVPVAQLDGSGEITLDGATWAATNDSGFAPANGGYLTLDLTWTNTEGVTHVNPFYLSVETAEGEEGTYDFFSDAQLSTEDLTDGASVEGRVSFDVVQSDSYTVIVLNELLQEVARITVHPAR
ncbi:DUF2510 domain-containing protein [Streptomyces sp. AC495_CC817]|uniref:DUF2510 domain-containing protein n=1 Tax=Streptomyces sp. AC495_CC817 TaxID=2823900 RepID=UPI001C262EC8|nr:DUF2510 domain-containing protein [Streptomyces sp. AC495_CC817]